MSTLSQRLQQADRPKVIEDTARLIDQEVANKSGFSGAALKAGYKVVKKLRHGFVEDAINHLLDEFSDALNPLYSDFLVQDDVPSFEAFLPRHAERAANDLLSITDRRAQRADNKALKSTYQKLRTQAEKHVITALPGVGRLIDTHAPKNA